MSRLPLAGGACLLFIHCAAPPPSAPAPVSGPELARRAPAVAPACRARGDLPDPACTPGDVETADLDVVCHQSTRDRRNVTQAVKRAVVEAYGAPEHVAEGDREIDHLVSLELGGSNDQRNLWPQPAPAFHEKDRLENELHKAVCSGRLDLRTAQQAIARDWRAAERLVQP